jgi:hypothetical protein
MSTTFSKELQTRNFTQICRVVSRRPMRTHQRGCVMSLVLVARFARALRMCPRHWVQAVVPAKRDTRIHVQWWNFMLQNLLPIIRFSPLCSTTDVISLHSPCRWQQLAVLKTYKTTRNLNLENHNLNFQCCDNLRRHQRLRLSGNKPLTTAFRFFQQLSTCARWRMVYGKTLHNTEFHHFKVQQD